MRAPGAKRLLAAIVLAAAATVTAAEKGDCILRLRGVYVEPDESADITVIGGDMDIDTDVMPEIDVTYFFSPNWAVELMAATTKHSVEAVDTTRGKVDLGSVRLLPPTLTLQYHHQLTETVRPYVGAGLNFTWFYDDELPEGVVVRTDYQDTVGWVLQAGIDFDIGERWVFNLDVKKVLLDTDVALNGGAIKADVDIDPWIFGVGIGYRF